MESCGAGCKFSAEYYRKNKAFFKTPELGDQIFFGDTKAGTESHTGIVVKLTDKMIYTVEGNVSNMVKEKSYNKNQIGKKIVGFGRPNWSITVKDETPTEKPTTEPAPKPKAKDEYKVISKIGVNIRKGKGSNYKKLGALNYGDVVKISKIDGAWAKLKDRDGWVFASCLKKC